MENQRLLPTAPSARRRYLAFATASVAVLSPLAAQITHAVLTRPAPDCARLLRHVRFTYASARQAARAHLACLNGGDCDNGSLALVEDEEGRAERAWRAYESACLPARRDRP